jgi:adenosylcobinamide amidohydrolase
VHSERAVRREGGYDLPALVWRPVGPALMVSSGPLGGGIGVRHWVVNATVPMSYARTDPAVHLAELAAGLGLTGPGTGLLTGVDVTRAVTVTDGGVTVVATVGLGDPIWAAAPANPASDWTPAVANPVPDGGAAGGRVARGGGVGTINVVAWVPARLAEAALVNAVATVAEAKVQAVADLSVSGTGTCTDATVVAGRPDGPVEWYGGPRSTWGARLARAVHTAVLRGGRAWLADPRAWSAP